MYKPINIINCYASLDELRQDFMSTVDNISQHDDELLIVNYMENVIWAGVVALRFVVVSNLEDIQKLKGYEVYAYKISDNITQEEVRRKLELVLEGAKRY